MKKNQMKYLIYSFISFFIFSIFIYYQGNKHSMSNFLGPFIVVLGFVSIFILLFSLPKLFLISSSKHRYLGTSIVFLSFPIFLFLKSLITGNPNLGDIFSEEMNILILAGFALFGKYLFQVRKIKLCSKEALGEVSQVIERDFGHYYGNNPSYYIFRITSYKVKFLGEYECELFESEISGNLRDLKKGDKILIKYNPMNKKDIIFVNIVE